MPVLGVAEQSVNVSIALVQFTVVGVCRETQFWNPGGLKMSALLDRRKLHDV